MSDPEPRVDRLRRVYDEIAPHFSQTRRHPWPEIETFVESVPARERALDVGCGNGRHAEVLSTRAGTVAAVDLSRGLLTEARDRLDTDVHLLQGEATALPVADDAVGLALYVATLHHLPGRARRRRSLDELARVLSPEGTALVSAWSTDHDRFDGRTEGFDTTVEWTLPGGETLPRYYHIYDRSEFRADLAASALTVGSVRVSSGNCYGRVTGGEGKHP